MKRILLFAASALALAACTQERPLQENKGLPIDFSVVAGTRASAITGADGILSLQIAAFNGSNQYFNDTFARENNTITAFTSTNKYFWPRTGTLDFYTIYPSITDLSYTGHTPTLTMTDEAKTLAYKPNSNVADQKDLLVAKASGSNGSPADGVVPLTLEHALSQVEVKAMCSNTTYDFIVGGVSLCNVAASGTYDFATKGWGLGVDKASYASTLADPITLSSTSASLMGTAGNLMVIPQVLTAWDGTTAIALATGAYLAVDLKIKTKVTSAMYFPDTDVFGKAYIPLATTFEAGKKYTIILDFSAGAGKDANAVSILGGEIKFSVSVADWTEAAGQEVDL